MITPGCLPISEITRRELATRPQHRHPPSPNERVADTNAARPRRCDLGRNGAVVNAPLSLVKAAVLLRRRVDHCRRVPLNIRTFVDPQNPNRVGLFMEVAEMDAFQAVMESEAGAAAMKYDGVRPETLVVSVES